MEGAAAAAGSSSLVFRGCQLPPGFRFQPTDQEIIVHYLRKKIAATAPAVTSIIADVDIYKFDPWDLPDKALFGDGEWFFFSPRDRKYPNGGRPNRTAGSGYWKATGTDKPILAAGGAHCLGVKKALVFYQGRSPKGTKTEWVMHEYRLLHTDAAVVNNSNNKLQGRSSSGGNSMRLDDWVLCRVRNKGSGCLQLSSVSDMDEDTSTDDPSRRRAAAQTTTAQTAATGLTMMTSEDGLGDDWPNNDDDGQLLQYLMAGGGGGGGGEQQQQQQPSLVSVLESIKRNLSFQAIDELYLLQPSSKRANYMGINVMGIDDDDDHRHHTSFSISSQTDDDVF